MLRLLRPLQIVLALTALLLVTSIGAASVSASGVVGNGTPGSCTQKAFNAKLSGGGTITFNCGKNAVTITLTGVHSINANTTIDGGNKITLAASGNQLFGVPPGKALTLKNITLANGRAPNGGAILNQGTLTLRKVTFNGNHATTNGGAINNQGTLNIIKSKFNLNQATSGGAIYFGAGTATLSGSTFSQNNGQDGGALNVASGAAANISDSTFSNNTGSYGAGAENNGTLNIERSVFDQNAAAGDGGAIWNLFGNLTLEDTTLSHNTAGTTGGGISNYGDGTSVNNRVTLSRVTLSNNGAGTFGGGMYSEDTAKLENVTIGENTADGDGGGYYNALGTSNFNFVTIANNHGDLGYGIFRAGGTVNLKNTLLASNSVFNCHGTITSQGHNLSADNTCPGLNQGGDKNNTAQGITNLYRSSGYTDTYELYGNKPALDAGINTGTPPTDQRGSSRSEGSAPDIGSVEQCQSRPGKAVMVVPYNGGTVKAGRISLSWSAPGCSLYSQVIVVAGAKNGPIADESDNLALPQFKTQKLPKGTYYWQVYTRNDGNFAEAKSAWFMFKAQ